MSILMDILRQYTGSAYSDLTSILRSRVNVVLKVDNSTDSIVFPVVPGEFPDLTSPQGNDTFASAAGDINVIGPPKLRTISFSSIFPVSKNYPFVRAGATYRNGWEYINWIEKRRRMGVVFRLMFVETLGAVKLDLLCTIDSFVYHQERNNDIKFQIDFREYKKPPVDIAADQAAEGVIE
ncbi:MAG: hypothetical protein ACLVJS_08765 [Acidaminococcus intestini]